MKKILNCIGSGIQNLGQNKRLVLPFYLINLASGLLMVMPLTSFIDDFIDGSLVRESLESKIDWGFILEFLHHNSSSLVIFKSTGIIAPLFCWLLTLYLSAGAIANLASNEPTSIRDFLKSSVDYAGRITRLALMAIPLLALLYCFGYLADLIQRIAFGKDPYGNIAYFFSWAKIALSYIGIMIFGLIFDYARIDIVKSGETKVRRSLWRSIKFVLRNILQTSAIAIILVAFGILVMLLTYKIANLYSTENWAMVWFLIVIQQLYIAFQIALRLTGYGSHLSFYSRN